MQLSILILNHNGEGYRHLGIVGHGWFGIHGTRPDARRGEWGSLTGGNRPLGAAADHQRQEHESPHPSSTPVRREEALNKEATVCANREEQ